MEHDFGNESDISNYTYYDYEYEDYITHWTNVQVSQYVVKGFVFSVGSAINLWFLLAILGDSDLRKRLRNQLICSLLVAYLVDTISDLPIILTSEFLYFNLECYEIVLRLSIASIQDGVENWLFAILLAVYLTSIVNFKTNCNPILTKMGHIFLLVSPWIFLLNLIPAITSVHLQSFTIGNFTTCVMDFNLIKATHGMDIFVIILSTILLVAALVLKSLCVRDTPSSRNAWDRFQKGEDKSDSAKAFVCGVILMWLFEMPYHIMTLSIHRVYEMLDNMIALYLELALGYFNDIRHVFMPLIWLLIPEIRQRLKTWRPRRPHPLSSDFVFLYRKDSSDQV